MIVIIVTCLFSLLFDSKACEIFALSQKILLSRIRRRSIDESVAIDDGFVII
jgi:hypothetical protein